MELSRSKQKAKLGRSSTDGSDGSDGGTGQRGDSSPVSDRIDGDVTFVLHLEANRGSIADLVTI